MCVEYGITPVKTDTCLLLCLCPLSSWSVTIHSYRRLRSDRLRSDRFSSFCGVASVRFSSLCGVASAPLFRWADAMSYFLSHKFDIIDFI